MVRMCLEPELRKQSECYIRDADPDLFVYEHVQDLDIERIEAAKQYCGACAIKRECREFGLANVTDAYAVFGGELMSPERKVLSEAAVDRILARL